ncbi:MAG: YciI family protein [Chitinophagales bacterium]
MKYYGYLILGISLLMSTLNIRAQQDQSKSSNDQVELKQYYFVMLSKGPHRNQDSTTAAKIQEGHLNNIRRLGSLGKLLVAGPFGDNGDWLGIFIFDCKTREEVESYLKTDPAIAAGRLNYDIHPWWTAKNCVFK